MKKSSVFQIILLIVAGFGAVTAILIFSGFLPGFRAKTVSVGGTITLWGTVPERNVAEYIGQVNSASNNQFSINYVEKDPQKIGDQLLDALASDNAPDAALLPQELIFKYRSKIFPIPLTSLTKRQYADNFVDGANIFETPSGYLALPVAVDPVVLYYNKDLYNSAGISLPPKSWEEFVANQPKLTILDNTKHLTQSAVALGTTNNISNFKDIFSLLLLQAGVSPVDLGPEGNLIINLNKTALGGLSPASLVIDFYLQFADSLRSTYSWDRSQPEAREAFLAGTLANYIGSASDLAYITAKNPHLNFDVTLIPRATKGNNVTYGRFYGLTVFKRSAKTSPALSSIFALGLGSNGTLLSDNLGGVPVRRTVLAQGSSNSYKQIFYKEALNTRSWFDFDSVQTNAAIKQLIDDVSSGRLSKDESIKKAQDALNLLLN